jgi:hypothetical protein
MMTAWDDAVQTWLDRAEQVTRLYPTELAEYKRDHPMPNVGDFMKGAF